MKILSSVLLITYLFNILILLHGTKCSAQNAATSDSLIKTILNESNLTGVDDKGVTLIKSNKFWEANEYYSSEIKKDEGNKEAYFNRGVINWALNDTKNACRDWSSVLALGDTAAFKLLDKNCHGEMIIEDDTIPSMRYRKIFAAEKKDDKTLSANSKALTVVEEMPQFAGGDMALFKYLSENLKYPADAREKGLQGTVYVNFIISKKGNVLFPYVTRGIGSACDEEALRVIRKMPPWKSGKQNGKPVLVRHNLPVRFSLK